MVLKVGNGLQRGEWSSKKGMVFKDGNDEGTMVFKDGTGPFMRTPKEGGGRQRGEWSSKGAGRPKKREVVLLQGHSKKGVVLKGSSGPKEGSGPLTRSLKEGSSLHREQWSKKREVVLLQGHSKKGVVFIGSSGPKRGKWSSYKVTQRREWSSKMPGPHFQCSSVKQRPIHPTKGNSQFHYLSCPTQNPNHGSARSSEH